ncbi:MAG: MogA/MoaB family molybdenum cofactor biosynthesis protein [Candidatus Bipolaricaulota bacterium]|nr:MogA/MoaB family molybdenum cofactor biosynthesis protein [Candidatus Bipolaricaulota bacterium]MCS7274719.1 MogA/MoaB family molybdenum cofactor biosynthesis protein [Candidatus Bipolaricaulota bacterium]MDW8109996.1 MogA/MoaB family molybdenum cofactor biosynthesis protein [Candidatus Bipolaricaulota bacterium]MDW8328932.1 MogA/MoaB family molybdenum cofactor biosynthesis protein [Candidatus Bipolaricaulota bacterium]
MNSHIACASKGANVVCWVVTVSDTRTEQTDITGKFTQEQLRAHGHHVALYQIIKNDTNQIISIAERFRDDPHAHVAIFLGGTGLSSKDRTARTLRKLYDEEIMGFGELFRMLSYHEVGPYALLSRASAGVINQKLVFSLPGSENAVRLAIEKLIVPILGHAVEQLRK